MPVTNEAFVNGLYIALLDRVADPTGLNTWLVALNAGQVSREQVIQSFLDSQEYAARSSSGKTATETISTFYSNAFDRPADVAGVEGWASLVAGGRSLASVINNLFSVLDAPNNGDGQRFANAIASAIDLGRMGLVAGVKDYWVGGERDTITSSAASLAVQKNLDQTHLGLAAVSPTVNFDHLIKGDDFPGTTLNGTEQNDLMISGSKTAVLYGLGGHDLLQGTASNEYFWPGAGADTVEAGPGNDIIDARFDTPATRRDVYYGQDGNDSVFGGASDEFIDGGDGNDFVLAGSGNDTVRGGIGNDELVKRGPGQFNILGEDGDDKITVSDATNGQVNGGSGNDRIDIETVDSISVYSGSGNDTVSVKNVKSGSYVFLNEGDDQLSGSDLQAVAIDGGDGNDRIILQNAKNITINLGAGNDIVELYNCENVTVRGGNGLDTFIVKNSRDLTLDGGAQKSVFRVDAASLMTNSLNIAADSYISNNDFFVEDLNNGNVINIDKNFSKITDLYFDYSVRAKFVVDTREGYGYFVTDVVPSTGGPVDPAFLFDFHNSNQQAAQSIRSDFWFMCNGRKPFNAMPTDLGNLYEGYWHTSSDSLTYSLGGVVQTFNFDDVQQAVRNPNVINGDLFLSWVII